MNNGYIKLSRNINEWEFYTKPDYLLLWIEILRRASYRQTEYRGEVLQPGEFTTSLSALSNATGLNTNSIHHKLKVMTKRTQIQQHTNRQRTKITVLNWEKYQCVNTDSTQTQLKLNSDSTQTQTIKNKEKRIKKKEVVLYTDFFPDDEINRWVGKVSDSMLEDWKYFDPNQLLGYARKAYEWQQDSGKKYKSIARFLNGWFNRTPEYVEQLNFCKAFRSTFEPTDNA